MLELGMDATWRGDDCTARRIRDGLSLWEHSSVSGLLGVRLHQ